MNEGKHALPVDSSPEDGLESTAAGLADKRVVVTRAQHQAGEMVDLLRQASAIPVLYPCLAIEPPADLTLLDDALKRAAAGDYDRLVLTSANSVLILAQRLAVLEISLQGLPVATVGPKTAAAAATLLNLDVDLVAGEHVAEALADTIAPVPGERLLLPQSAIARPVLAHLLGEAGAQVTVVVAYQTGLGWGGEPVPEMLAAGQIAALTFTSSSTVANFLKRLENEGGDRRHLTGVCLAAIGPITADAMDKSGLPVDVVPVDYTLAGLITALDAYFTS